MKGLLHVWAVASTIIILGLLIFPGTVAEAKDSPLPPLVDNSRSPAFPPIGDQGPLNSCIAWATTYYQLSYEYSLVSGNSTIFSPKWTYNMINGGQNSYTTFSDAYSLLQKNGAAAWTDLPYDSDIREWSLSPTAWRRALNCRISSVEQIYNSDINLLIENLKTQLVNGRVITIMTYVQSWNVITVGNDPTSPDQDPFTGQLIAAYMNNSQLEKHAMTVVGYDDGVWADLNGNLIVDNGEKGAFKVANSKGPQDWNSGFRWVAYDALRRTSIIPINGPTWPPLARSTEGIFLPDNVYIVSVRPFYSPTLTAEVTLNHAKRRQIALNLGTGQPLANVPTNTWTSAALRYSGGDYAFDGTTSARDGTFFFDFTVLATSTSGNTRWFVGIADNTPGEPAVIKSFKLYKATDNGDILVASNSTPIAVDSAQAYIWVDYAANTPMAMTMTTAGDSGGGGQIRQSTEEITRNTTAEINLSKEAQQIPSIVSPIPLQISPTEPPASVIITPQISPTVEKSLIFQTNLVVDPSPSRSPEISTSSSQIIPSRTIETSPGYLHASPMVEASNKSSIGIQSTTTLVLAGGALIAIISIIVLMILGRRK